MLKLKQGVELKGLSTQSTIAIMVAERAYAKHGYDCWVTSASDSEHGYASLHYIGNAVDFRIRNVEDSGTVNKIHMEMKSALGGDYDVVLESDHIHVEYQPKV